MTEREDNRSPERMCVVCRRRFPKEALERYVRPANAQERDAAPVPDPAQTMPGRGYYVCGQARCRERFPKVIKGLMKQRER
ncbi:MAG: DUF448 domain-containing protein [Desulfovibrionaceae bacterium]|nr:DUF448 domain-containing protein [Desulfovibrionaceae bacterium]